MSADDFLAALDGIDERMRALEPVALGKAAEHVRAVAAPLTPVETGALVGSAEVIVLANETDVYYPGPYSRNQEFSLDFRHTTGQALFLSQPMITEVEPVMKIVADTLGEAF